MRQNQYSDASGPELRTDLCSAEIWSEIVAAFVEAAAYAGKHAIHESLVDGFDFGLPGRCP